VRTPRFGLDLDKRPGDIGRRRGGSGVAEAQTGVLQPVNKGVEAKSGHRFSRSAGFFGSCLRSSAGSRPTFSTYKNKGFGPDFRQTNFDP
jgi:hypothetical protein